MLVTRGLFVASVFLIPNVVFAGTVDLQLTPSDISFSDDLIAGSEVRIYVHVTNVGDEDVSGYVSFFQGSVPIGDSQVISVRAGGVPEEVYVDFVVPTGDFNIRAEIRGTDPEDENDTNNSAVTKLLEPVLDDDRDGVVNEEDNCPSESNANQKNSDDDAQGDACDADDDNDTVSDDVEDELGSDSTISDTDGDGVEDAKDAYPTDVTRSVVPPPAHVKTVPVVTSNDTVLEPEPAPEQITSTDTTSAGAIAEPPAEVEVVGEQTVDVSGLGFSPHSVFTYTRLAWNRFIFAPTVPLLESQQSTWDFGDGVVSQRSTVEHTFQRPGSYVVVLQVTNADGTSSSESVDITVPFFSLENRVVVAGLAVLSLFALLGLWTAWRVGRSTQKRTEAVLDKEGSTITDKEPDDEVMPPLNTSKERSHKLTVRSLDSDDLED